MYLHHNQKASTFTVEPRRRLQDRRSSTNL